MSPLFLQMSPLFQERWDIVPIYEIAQQNTVLVFNIINNSSMVLIRNVAFNGMKKPWSVREHDNKLYYLSPLETVVM